MASMSFTSSTAQRKIEKILQAISKSDQTVASVEATFFLSRRWAREYLEHLRQQRRIHITRYEKELINERPYPRPVYRIGEGRDAPKPAPMSNKEKTAARRKRRREDPEYYLHERAGNQLRKLKVKPDRAAAWLMTP